MKFTDPYINTNICVKRLVNVYKKHKDIIIGFDFDNTIYNFNAPNDSFEIVRKVLEECSDLGLTLILYTCCCSKEEFSKKMRICFNMGLKVTPFTANKVKFEEGGKQYFNILLDDKAGLGQSVTILKQALDEIKLLKNVEGNNNENNS